MNNTTKSLIGRCKHCDYTLFCTQEDVQQGGSLDDIKQPGVVYNVGGTCFARCDQRHPVFVLHPIKGTYSADHQCDARCLNARGWECTCSCGGANHGRGHVVAHVSEAKAPAPTEAPVRREKILLGEEGKHIKGSATVTGKKVLDESTLYTFRAVVSPTEVAIIKWFAPNYVAQEYEIGQVVRFRAKVKRHEDHPEYGKSTLVTYFEELPLEEDS